LRALTLARPMVVDALRLIPLINGDEGVVAVKYTINKENNEI